MENNNSDKNNSDIAFIFKRSFLGFFWFIFFIPLFAVYFLKPASSDNVMVIIWFVIFYGIIAAIYSFIVSHTKLIESAIRLMSSKDNYKISTQQSLFLSKKIFKDSIKFRWGLFLKYYWLISLIYFVVFTGAIYEYAFSPSLLQKGIALAALGVVVLFSWAYVHFFLAAKTRFALFIYISHFGEHLSNNDLFSEMEKLNAIDLKSNKDAMKGYFKRDKAVDIGSIKLYSNLDTFSSKELGSDITKGYSRWVMYNASEYSKMKLNYNQYQIVYKKVYGKDPELSQNLLNLK